MNTRMLNVQRQAGDVATESETLVLVDEDGSARSEQGSLSPWHRRFA
jgi:hypothetical protein